MNGVNGANSHEKLASGQAQDADKEDDDSEDDKDDAANVGADGVNGGMTIAAES